MGSNTGGCCTGLGLLYERGNPRPVQSHVVKHMIANLASISQSDPREVDWKQSFYGANYEKLYSIKAKYDPYKIFYGNTSVGSDEWYLGGNGALCWAGNKGGVGYKADKHDV